MLALVLHKTITIPLKCVKYDSSALWSLVAFLSLRPSLNPYHQLQAPAYAQVFIGNILSYGHEL